MAPVGDEAGGLPAAAEAELLQLHQHVRREVVVDHGSVDVLVPEPGLAPQLTADHPHLGYADVVAVVRRHHELVGRAPLRRGRDCHRGLGQVGSTLGRGHHDRHRAVTLLAAVEKAQRVSDHPRGLMVIEGDGPLEEERVGVGRGVPAVGDSDRAEVGRRGAVLVHVAARLHRYRRRRRGETVRIGPRVVQPVGVDLRRRPVLHLPEPLARALVEAAVADHHLGHIRRDGHRGLLHSGAGSTAAVVDPAEEPQRTHAELTGERDLRAVVHREGDQTVYIRGRQPCVRKRVQRGLGRELQLRATGLLGELRRTDARDRRLAAEAHRDTASFAVTWSPSGTRPTTSMVRMPSVSSVTSPEKRNVS